MAIAVAGHGGHTIVLPSGAARTPLPPPDLPPAGLGRLRKIAICGSASTIDFAPFHDASWEIWGHAVCVGRYRRVNRLFDLHPKLMWHDTRKPQWPTYPDWLAKCRYPVYMQEKYPEVPQSVRYPYERIFAEFREHCGNQTDYMVALALSEGVTHLGFYGVHYDCETERYDQLLTMKYWLGFAEGRGVQLVIPKGNPLFSRPSKMYGYQTHQSAEEYEMRRKKELDIRKAMGKTSIKSTLEPFDPAVHTPKLKPLHWGDTLGNGPAFDRWNRLAPYLSDRKESHEPEGQPA